MVETLDALGRRMKDPYLLSILGAIAASQVQKNIIKGPWAPNAPLTREVKGSSLPLRDRGQLLASITSGTENDKAVVGTNHPAARILHYGGTIVPKNTQFLAVPTGDARAFMRIYGATPRACIENMEAAGYSFFYGGPVLCARLGKGRIHALFIMKKSVTIPARPYMTLPPESVKVLELAAARRIWG
jgi:phage gpG-like protein